MSTLLSQKNILECDCDTAVVSLEMTMKPAAGKTNEVLAATGGGELLAAIRELRFLPIGSAAEICCPALPFSHVIVTPVPRWLTGKANELFALRRCYESVFTIAESIGSRSVVMPFLSTVYYGFPPEEAVYIALQEAEKQNFDVMFIADTDALYEVSQRPYRKPKIVSYVGYYRDYAVFLLDNGKYARVDLRPEIVRTDVVPYVEACYRKETDPGQIPLSEDEIARLRAIYDLT